MIQTTSKVISNEGINEDCWLMTVEAHQIASEVRPGQFINIKILKINSPLFRRPFSVYRTVALDNNVLGISIIYKVVGTGTKLMTTLGAGDEVDIIGPLGKGFQFHKDKKTHILLAGGVGAAGLFILGEDISRAVDGGGVELYVLLGAKTKKRLILEREFATLKGKVLASTDDGTCGFHGSVTQMLEDAIVNGNISTDCSIYACGPELMYKTLVPFCRQNSIPSQIAMERRMMCGIGACVACVCKVNKKIAMERGDLTSSHMQFIDGETFGHALVCRDGPVFRLDEVIFDGQ